MTSSNESTRLLALLELHRSSLILDLEVQDVIPELLEKLVFGHEDKQRVEHEKTYEERAAVLLDIIRKKAEAGNTTAIPVFINSLQEKYTWLYLKLTQDELDSGPIPFSMAVPFLASADEQKIKRILEAGGVHGLPRYTIERTEHLESIRKGLAGLEGQEYLVLTGMAGCGKSVLAMQALHSKLLLGQVFKGGIFWLSIGKECSETKDAILAKMRSLGEKLGEIRAPHNLENGAEILRAAFQKRPDSLLILDDVWRPEVVRAFDLGCRTLLTTRDESVMDVVALDRVKSVKISAGFTAQESLQLFCQSLGTTQANLPEEAELIHAECKGSPMVISLISALFHDHDIEDTGRWNHYLHFLRKRKFSQMRGIRGGYEHQSILDAISLSVDGLEEKDREFYLDFALFQDDVGIPCMVLETLWNLDRYDVEDVMNRLVRKSLAAEEYDPQRKCRVYSVHDLQLDYLKYRLCCMGSGDTDNEKQLHRKLLAQYQRKCGSGSAKHFEKLPDDGYIHSYIGYHLYKAGMRDEFPIVFLNLLFVGEKMRVAGPADLLVDLRKYKEFILGDNEQNTSLLEEITTFAQSAGHRIYNQPDADVVQITLEMPHLRKLHELAREIARRSPSRLYLEWSNASSDQWKNAESVVLCSDNVRCIKFVDANHFLAGLSNGRIELCNLPACRICHVYSGHGGAVQTIDVLARTKASAAALVFVSGSDDRTCKLWNLNSEELEHGGSNCKSTLHTPDSPSPKIRQDLWAVLDKSHDDDKSFFTFEFHTAPVLHVEFSPTTDGSRLISTSLNEILIWSAESGQIVQKISPDFPSSSSLSATFQACHFSRSHAEAPLPYLLMSCENKVVIYSAQTPSLFSSVEGHYMKIVALLQLPEDAFCTVSENEIGLWRVAQGPSPPARVRAPARRGVSPARSYPLSKTQVDAIPLEEGAGTNGFLHPSTATAGSRNSSYSSSGSRAGSPTLSSDGYTPSPSIYTRLDDGRNMVEIHRETVHPKKGPGLFQCAAATESGELLACGTSDRRVVLWHLADRKWLGEFRSHNGNLICLDFSRVDRWALLSGSEDHTVMMWDLEEEHAGRKEPHKNPATFASIFIDGGDEVTATTMSGHFLSIFSTDKNSIQIYEDNKCVCEATPSERGAITAIAVRGDGRCAVIANEFGNIYRVKLAEIGGGSTPSLLRLIGSTKEKITHLLLQDNQNGSLFAAATVAGNVLLFSDFKLLRVIKCESECPEIVALHFPFDSACVLAIVCREDVILRVENAETALRLRGWKVNEELPVRVTCSACAYNEANSASACLAIGTRKRGIFIFALDAGAGVTKASHIPSKQNTSVRSLHFSSAANRLAAGHESGVITVWRQDSSGQYEEELDLVFHKARVRVLRFSPDGKWLVSCGDKLAFWSLDKPAAAAAKPSFMEERRRKKSGDNCSRPPSRLSLEIGDGVKIGRRGKRELLQSFFFRGSYAQNFVADPDFRRFVVVDDSGLFYIVGVMPSSIVS